MEYAEYFFSLDVGSISNPIPYLGGWLLGRVSDKQHMQPPQFDIIEKRVLAVYQQNKADEAVNDYLRNLKRSAKIEKYEKP